MDVSGCMALNPVLKDLGHFYIETIGYPWSLWSVPGHLLPTYCRLVPLVA